MSRPEDDAWDELELQLELERAAEYLPQAEIDVRNVEPCHVSQAWIDAMVDKVTASSKTMPKRRSPLRILLTACAACLLMLTLGATASRLIWPEQRDSEVSMSYARQVELVLADSTCIDSDDARGSALGWIADRACAGIRSLREFRAQPGISGSVANSVDLELEAIRDLLEGKSARSRTPSRDDQKQLMVTLSDPQQHESRKSIAMHALAETTMDNIGIIQRMWATSSQLTKARATALRHIQKQAQ